MQIFMTDHAIVVIRPEQRGLALMLGVAIDASRRMSFEWMIRIGDRKRERCERDAGFILRDFLVVAMDGRIVAFQAGVVGDGSRKLPRLFTGVAFIASLFKHRMGVSEMSGIVNGGEGERIEP